MLFIIIIDSVVIIVTIVIMIIIIIIIIIVICVKIMKCLLFAISWASLCILSLKKVMWNVNWDE